MSPTRVATLSEVDLTDPATHLRPDLADFWARQRAERPVAWHPPVGGRPGFWVVSPHGLATEVYRDSARFTSERGNVLATLLHGGDSAGGRMLAVSDGTRHRQIRRELLKSFSPANLASLRTRVREAMRGLVARAVGSGGCDFAVDVAPHIPLTAICDLLDIPVADRDELFANASTALASQEQHADELEATLARNGLLFYFTKLRKRRAAAPAGDDLVGRLVGMTRGPLALTDDELVFNCYSLLLGGDETTRLALIGTVRALAEHPDLWARLRAGDLDRAVFVEELLRWTTPALHAGRVAVTDTVLGDAPVRAGDVVTVWNNSANFDGTEFADPHRLDPDRTPNRHLSFAYGPHFCLGAALARIELVALLDALADLVAEITVTGEPKPIYSTFLSGLHSLPVRFTPAGEGGS
ncbi:cytochrome P450 [Actinosynnema sp. NPDC023587]|uniref:cytochrome P450 n=1 Tax=Actinosynnema sp. NPDC023587 TaxID=3154695 RepID=UPI0033DD1D96